MITMRPCQRWAERSNTPASTPGAIWLAAICVLAGCTTAMAAQAQGIADPATTLPPVTDIQHIIQPGDTLEALSRRYADDRRAWTALGTLNQIRDPRRLRPGSVLRIPSRLLPAETATVEFTRGAVAVVPATGSAVQAAPATGDRLAEGTRLQVGPDAFVTLRLADGSVIRVRAGSDVQLQQLRRRGRAGSVQSVLDLRGGGVESSVAPQTDPARRFDVRTPTATTSVRGTQFTVDLAESGRATTSVDQGSVTLHAAAASNPATAASTPLASKTQSQAQAVTLQPGQGVAVAANGQLSSVRPLLPAPDLSLLPATWQDAEMLAVSVPPLAGASAYQLQLARDSQFTEVVRSQRSDTPTSRWSGLPDGRYYLSVRGVDDAGILGRAAMQSITVKTQPVPPLYQSPAPGGTVDRKQGELRCTGVDGANFYRIQLASDPSFTQPLVHADRLAECQTTIAQVPPGAYFWRAASGRDLPDGTPDIGPYAKPQRVVVGEAPAPLSAASLQVADDSGGGARLYWAGEPGQTFQLQVSANGDFSQPLVDTHLSQPAWASSELPAGRYQVRIKVMDPSGLQSSFSSARSFSVPAAVQSGTGLPVTASDGQPLTRP